MKYSLYDSKNHLVAEYRADNYYIAIAEAQARNLELRQSLPILRIGRKKIYRYKVLRKITQQLEIFV